MVSGTSIMTGIRASWMYISATSGKRSKRTRNAPTTSAQYGGSAISSKDTRNEEPLAENLPGIFRTHTRPYTGTVVSSGINHAECLYGNHQRTSNGKCGDGVTDHHCHRGNRRRGAAAGVGEQF